jgi:hypothetical protein
MTAGGHNKPSPRCIQRYNSFLASSVSFHARDNLPACSELVALPCPNAALRFAFTQVAEREKLSHFMSDIVRDVPSVVCSKLLIAKTHQPP